MQNHEQDLLIKEFEAAWKTIQAIDSRRGEFARYFSVIFTAILGIAGKIFIDAGALTIYTAISITFLFFFGALSGCVMMGILKSERRSNIRYRQKINLIREIFLKNSKDKDIQKYLKHKELGIKMLTNQAKEQPHGVGQTLRGIFNAITIQIVVLLISIVAIWIYYLS